MDDVKAIVRSILVSYPGNCTISQLMDDYVALEGQHLPYKKLGFNSVLDVIQNMNDVLKVPPHPSMNSFVKLIVDEKTSHLRQLVVNQKANKKKKRYPRKCYPSVRENVVSNKSYNYGNSYNYENHTNEYCASRGYDFVNNSPVHSSKKKGHVTNQLQKSIENLCKKEQSVSIRVLKNNLINHPDYKLLNSRSIEEAINMLKYFIYIDKSGVHLKNSSYEIYPEPSYKLKNHTEPKFGSVQLNVTNEDEELAINDYGIEDDFFEITEYFDNLDVDNQESKNYNKLVTQQKNESACDIPEVATDNQESISYDKLVTQQKVESACEITEVAIDYQQSKCENILKTQEKKESSYKMPKIASNLTTSNIQFKTQIKGNEDKNLISDLLVKDNDYYKKAITSVIESSQTPITINEALSNYEITYGSSFPIQKFSCRTPMDFFRLYPALFLLDDPYTTNSIIKIGKPMEPKQKIITRRNLINASIFMYKNEENLKQIDSIENQNALKQSTDKISHQKTNENSLELATDNISYQKMNENDLELITDNISYKKMIQNVVNGHYSDSSDSCIEVHDSEMILDSMKKKMRSLLNKHYDGILCDTFMDVYGKEYNTYFTYSEYGFKSMRDMAYNLPSVFYVKVTESGDYYLYNASRRNELKVECHDPLQYYKNIPKSILRNLSIFFDNNRNGIQFHELKFLYCSKFGRSYEPLKYGYSSEKHMFESLNKMVKIENNIVYTINPYAYIPFENNENAVMKSEETLPVLPVYDNILNYSGYDVCSEKFEYNKLQLYLKYFEEVVAAEIYSPVSFYINLSQSIDNLNSFMDSLQLFYNNNEDKYRVLPELITPGLACISCFEDTQLWHRAKVLKVVDEHNVQLFYVDYGSVEMAPKSKVRLLEKRFGVLPVQAIYCSLYKSDDEIHYSIEINEMFANMIDNQKLEAQFNNSKIEDVFQKNIVTLYLKRNNIKINVNAECSRQILADQNSPTSSIRRLITDTIENTMEDTLEDTIEDTIDDKIEEEY